MSHGDHVDDHVADEEAVRNAMTVVLGRQPGAGEVESFGRYVAAARLTRGQVAVALQATSEAVTASMRDALELHLFAIHLARVRLIATMLPPANRILDLGGAAAPLCDTGYPHPFEQLTIIDLPPEDRHEEFAGRIVAERTTAHGVVRVAYTSMVDLSMFDDFSIDLVWSGESLEHIEIEDARRLYAEVRRVLRPDGWFCLDTPNRKLTRIHAEGGMIHPDHRHEYEPDELVAELCNGGFDVVRSLGVCDMPLTASSGMIDYRDFVAGAGVTTALDSAYIQYHACRPSRTFTAR